MTLLVAAKAPELDPTRWWDLFGIGLFTSALSLQCLRLIFGKATWWFRMPFGAVGLCMGMVLFYLLGTTRQVLVEPSWSIDWLDQVYVAALSDLAIARGVEFYIPSTLLGISVVSLALLLARGIAWFGNLELDELAPVWFALPARVGLVSFKLCLLSPIAYLFYRLMTPSPWPPAEAQLANGLSDLVEARSLADPDYFALYRQAGSGVKANAEDAMERLAIPLTIVEARQQPDRFQVTHYEGAAKLSHQLEGLTPESLGEDVLASPRYGVPNSLIVAGPAAPYLWLRLRACWSSFQTWWQEFEVAPQSTALR